MMGGYHWEHMTSWMGSWGWAAMGVMAIVWIVVLALVVYLLLRLFSTATTRRPVEPPDDRAESLLRERFARGEISESEYRQARQALREPAP